MRSSRLLVACGVALGIVAFGAANGCSSPAADEDPSPSRACGIEVWTKPASPAAHVEIVGDWDGWKRPGVAPEERPDGWRAARIDVPPGEHAYAIVEDGVWLLDKSIAVSAFQDGREVSVTTAADCAKPALRVDAVETTTAGHATVRATFLRAAGGDRVDVGSIVGTTKAGATLRVTSIDEATGAVVLEADGLIRGKYMFSLRARDRTGRDAEEARATAWVDGLSGPSPWDHRDAIVYQVLVDRFRGDDGALAPPAGPAERAGGTLRGVRNALEAGDFEALGINTLWLSPLYANPTGEFPGNDGRSYTSYHGYWPIAERALDPRFANEEELDAFVSAAHARGIRVLFDVVPNHVHAQHPWTKEHADWFKPGCICGQPAKGDQPACDWATNIDTCWFAPYLPDLDWTNTAAARAMTDEVLWWLDRWDADGIRVDAVPMMPRAATRRIAHAVRSRYAHGGYAPYVLGENFTGPGAFQSLRYDLGPFGLDGSFHFPLMWTLREAIALEKAPMSEIDATFRAGEVAWDGAGAVMGLMIGNHDVSRFASVSAGNDSGDTWTSPPQPIDPLVYGKQRLALGAVLTMPGAPVLYYGDEVGLAGRSDPDCRRVMPAEAALSEAQRETRELARSIGRARACAPALRRGALHTLVADKERFVFARELASSAGDGPPDAVPDTVIVALSRRPTTDLDLPWPSSLPAGAELTEIVTQARIPTGASLRLGSEPFSVRVFVSSGSPCAARLETRP